MYSNQITYVSNITFEGNIKISTSELKQIIKLQEPQIFSRTEFSTKKPKNSIPDLDSQPPA